MKYMDVYAIIRIDDFLAVSDIDSKITIKKIVWSMDNAKNEVKRLNMLNSDKGCRYFWQHTRLENIEKY